MYHITSTPEYVEAYVDEVTGGTIRNPSRPHEDGPRTRHLQLLTAVRRVIVGAIQRFPSRHGSATKPQPTV
jgi:hypothetical protein